MEHPFTPAVAIISMMTCCTPGLASEAEENAAFAARLAEAWRAGDIAIIEGLTHPSQDPLRSERGLKLLRVAFQYPPMQIESVNVIAGPPRESDNQKVDGKPVRYIHPVTGTVYLRGLGIGGMAEAKIRIWIPFWKSEGRYYIAPVEFAPEPAEKPVPATK